MQPRATDKRRKLRPAAPPAKALLQRLPAVARVQADPTFEALIERAGPELATDLVREELGRVRAVLRAGRLAEREVAALTEPAAVIARAGAAGEVLLAQTPRLVINATGVVVHTNLGRSVLSTKAALRLADAAAGYVDLEFDLERGGRGRRQAHLAPLFGRLFPGTAAALFNNNAAAILVALRALAAGKEVVVSRGELVEIGGSFRIPDILAVSGAALREVGTTNRTRLADYRNALTKRTGLLLKVHTSNFRIVGFTEATGIAELAGLAKKARVPLVVDWGSGDLIDLERFGIHDELPVRAILDAGADLVTFSADKLLGGPQAGIVVGRPALVERIEQDPLARACRVDRLRLATLHETLRSYVRGRAEEEIPTLRMIADTPERIGARAEGVRRKVASRTGQGQRLSLVEGVSRTGGGSSPSGERPTRLLVVDGKPGGAAAIHAALRAGDPPVLARVQGDKVLLDLRTVLPHQDSSVANRLAEVLAAEAPKR